jgi:septal ring factor EnvC (AmiA/AmiB activator)
MSATVPDDPQTRYALQMQGEIAGLSTEIAKVDEQIHALEETKAKLARDLASLEQMYAIHTDEGGSTNG